MRWMGHGQVQVCCFGAASARIESCSFFYQALVTCCRRANAEKLKMVALLEWRLAKSSLMRPPSLSTTCNTHKFNLWQSLSQLRCSGVTDNWDQSDLGWTGVLMKDVQLQNAKENGYQSACYQVCWPHPSPLTRPHMDLCSQCYNRALVSHKSKHFQKKKILESQHSTIVVGSWQ